MSPLFSDLQVMEVYGWTWDELLDTPQWVVAAAKAKMGIETEYANEAAQKQKRL